MPWLYLISCFFGGAFLMNAVPHLVCGVQGRPFQSPFAKPPGQGLSSSTVNVLWAFVNLVIAYLLLCDTGDFSLQNPADAVATGLGGLLIALFCARHFGRLHGGSAPERG